MNQVDYIECAAELPPNGQIVATKIDDAKGVRNEDVLLSRTNNRWFVPDGSMYVYYSPTHWRLATGAEFRTDSEMSTRQSEIKVGLSNVTAR